MVKAIIFDLDGTLLDRERSLRLFLDDQFERYREYFTQVQKNDYINYFIEYDAHGYVKKERVYSALIEQLNIQFVGEKDLLLDYKMNYPKYATEYPGAKEVIARLQNRGYKIGIITNGNVEHQRYIIDVLGIEKYVLETLISEAVGFRKPDPEIFMMMCGKLGVLPEECMFVGDHPVNDIEASRKLGMQTVFKDNHYFEMPDTRIMNHRIEDLFTLLTILDEETF
ncbi:HAD family hydrolase [Macrococcoides caseolyticum]|uniref:HAD family hydrolase n=1 Tax=Macrococcoides caseolyticum TaxID=69966 RepID=UPI001F21DC86|nr:HAD family hydrolase [Macrococcus caseolyticus]MCE4957771.1 HAD family hydrolase [Macrococcus caseolyticus]